jgi:tetratricopeptide (TPR) repeat protein
MRDLATTVQRAASLSRAGQDALAIAEIDEALERQSVERPTRAFLKYVRSMAATGSDSKGEVWPIAQIGDDVGDADIKVASWTLLRWAEARWVTLERVETLRSECARDWAIKAPQLAVALTAQARNLVRRGLLENAAIACRESVALWRDEDLQCASEGRKADALRLLGAIECSRGAHKAASAASAEACRLFRALCAQRRERHIASWASASHNLAGARLSEGDVGGAVAAIRVSVRLRRELVRSWPSLFRQDLAESLAEACRIFCEADLCEEAFALSAEAIAVALEPVDAAETDNKVLLIRALKSRSHCALAVYDWGAGLAAVDGEISLLRDVGCDREARSLLMLIEALHNRATFLTMLGEDGEALASLKDSIQLHARLAKETDAAVELLGASLHFAGDLAARAGDLEDSAAWFTQAAALRVTRRTQVGHIADGDITQSCIELANVSARLGRMDAVAEATQCSDGADSDGERRVQRFESDETGWGLLQLGNARRKLGDLESAISAYRSAAGLKRRLQEARGNVALAVTAARKLVACLKRAGRNEESEAWRQRFGINDRS